MKSTDRKKLANLYAQKTPSVKEAFAFQRELRNKVIKKNGFDEIKTVAGSDLAILTEQKRLVCGIIIFSYPELEEIEHVWEVVDENFPYIPGLLAFREGPAILETFKKIKNKPDIIMIDGQGIAHPRGFGVASHVGVLLDIPSIGVAKKRLYGKYSEPSDLQGSCNPLRNSRETIGAVLRTKNKVKPVFVSVGNKIDLKTAVKVTLNCSRGYRIPEPTRLADIYVSQLKKEIKV